MSAIDPLDDTYPEPGYEGLSWYQIVETINEYYDELWYEERARRELERYHF